MGAMQEWEALYSEVKKPLWSKGGAWYYEIFITVEGKKTRIGGSGISYKTKREATQRAKKNLAQYKLRYHVLMANAKHEQEAENGSSI